MDRITRAFLSAYMKGRRAAKENVMQCPYYDISTSYRNGVTFSRAFQNYWLEGHADERCGRPVKYQLKELRP